MMKITGLSHLFKWENLHNWWLTKYFFAPLYMYVYMYEYVCMRKTIGYLDAIFFSFIFICIRNYYIQL